MKVDFKYHKLTNFFGYMLKQPQSYRCGFQLDGCVLRIGTHLQTVTGGHAYDLQIVNEVPCIPEGTDDLRVEFMLDDLRDYVKDDLVSEENYGRITYEAGILTLSERSADNENELSSHVVPCEEGRKNLKTGEIDSFADYGRPPALENEKFGIRHDDTGMFVNRRLNGLKAEMYFTLEKAGSAAELCRVLKSVIKAYPYEAPDDELFFELPKEEEKKEDLSLDSAPPAGEAEKVEVKAKVVRKKKVDAVPEAPASDPAAPVEPPVNDVSTTESVVESKSEPKKEETMSQETTPAAAETSTTPPVAPAAAPADAATAASTGRTRRTKEQVMQDRIQEATEFLSSQGFSVTRTNPPTDQTWKETIQTILSESAKISGSIQCLATILENKIDAQLATAKPADDEKSKLLEQKVNELVKLMAGSKA